MTHFARSERDGLCDTFLDVGPAADTLCEGWTTADLATHLIVRDGRLDLLIGSVLPIVGARFKKGIAAIKHQPWPDLVDAVRSGPPVYSPTALGPVNELVNHAEFFIHHEDVRRAQPDWKRRTLPETQEQALWSGLRRTARLMYRKAPVGVELVSQFGKVQAKPVTPAGSVTVEGAASELLLASYGRKQLIEVQSIGAEDAVQALWSSKLGLA